MSKTDRPAASEHVPYYGRYISMVPDGPIVDTLRRQIEETAALLAAVPADREEFRYQEGKWSVKEVVGHLCDSERIFVYRALRFAREDTTPLAGFDENTYVPAGRFGRRTLQSLLEEYRSIRQATLALLDGLDDAALDRKGTANDNPITVRAIAWMIAGHERHHVGVLKERYGLSAVSG